MSKITNFVYKIGSGLFPLCVVLSVGGFFILAASFSYLQDKYGLSPKISVLILFFFLLFSGYAALLSLVIGGRIELLKLADRQIEYARVRGENPDPDKIRGIFISMSKADMP